MVGKGPRAARVYRTKWIVPVLAVALAALSAGLGQVAQARILAKPDQPITFLVEEGLPYGITQESVDAVAEDRALSYEPFTILIVERELTWDESQHGEFPQGADVMLSVGMDEEDVDLTLTDASRASVAKLAAGDDWQPNYDASSSIRETFLNNLTQGQGPSAVVGAAMTAASSAFDWGTRSPVFWVSVAALPLLVGLLMMALWARYLARERRRRRVFALARLELARVVLELDLLDAHVSIAGAELDRAAKGGARRVAGDIQQQLQADWSTIREESLELAHEEQVLARELLDPGAAVHERGAPAEPLELPRFASRVAALRRRADALVAASSLRVGHAGGGTVLGQIALSSTLALDDVLQRRHLLTVDEGEVLTRQRSELLALVHEAETSFAEVGPDVVARHADLLTRWRRAEHRLATTLARIERRAKREVPRGVTSHIDAEALTERVENRTRVATGGRTETLEELRASLDLAPKTEPPSHPAERILLIAEAIDEAKDGSGGDRQPRTGIRVDRLSPDFTPLAVVGLPLVIALIAGFAATSAAEAGDATYGRTLVGDEPLAALEVIGDPALLPPYSDPALAEREPPNIETLSLGFVRDAMASNADRSDAALLPERLDIVVALLPMDDYVTVRPHERGENLVQLDYLELLEVYPRITSEVAAVSPDTIDTATGEVRPGHAVVPLWIADDGSYGVGLPLTGTLSSGVDSRLGAYYFNATEPAMWNRPGEDSTIPVGWLVASRMSDLGREMEYNNLRAAGLPASALFWTVALATWTGVQALAMVGWSIAQLLLRNAGSRRARRQLRGLREKLNALALGLDLSRLDAVAVLGRADGHRGEAAEADQQLYETVLLTAWREVQTLEVLPRREQRGPDWVARVERLRATIDALADRDASVSERALNLVRSYG
ncbi:hypothetical protein [Microbacterium sp. MM2322]|uniref:hypothetical protein n=1 Tax=Microbacterium sp. MM2322 TaxID=3157631 RepID=UPI0032D57650